MTTGETAESLYPSDSTSSTTRSSSLNHSSQHSSQDRNRANSFWIYENTLGAETPPFDTMSMKWKSLFVIEWLDVVLCKTKKGEDSSVLIRDDDSKKHIQTEKKFVSTVCLAHRHLCIMQQTHNPHHTGLEHFANENLRIWSKGWIMWYKERT